jgi:hypothetical protein
MILAETPRADGDFQVLPPGLSDGRGLEIAEFTIFTVKIIFSVDILRRTSVTIKSNPETED